MPTYKIIIEKAAQKFLDKQEKDKRIRLYKAIYKLPNGTDIKKPFPFSLWLVTQPFLYSPCLNLVQLSPHSSPSPQSFPCQSNSGRYVQRQPPAYTR